MFDNVRFDRDTGELQLLQMDEAARLDMMRLIIRFIQLCKTGDDVEFDFEPRGLRTRSGLILICDGDAPFQLVTQWGVFTFPFLYEELYEEIEELIISEQIEASVMSDFNVRPFASGPAYMLDSIISTQLPHAVLDDHGARIPGESLKDEADELVKLVLESH